jgi:hypothetical protein
VILLRVPLIDNALVAVFVPNSWNIGPGDKADGKQKRHDEYADARLSKEQLWPILARRGRGSKGCERPIDGRPQLLPCKYVDWPSSRSGSSSPGVITDLSDRRMKQNVQLLTSTLKLEGAPDGNGYG